MAKIENSKVSIVDICKIRMKSYFQGFFEGAGGGNVKGCSGMGVSCFCRPCFEQETEKNKKFIIACPFIMRKEKKAYVFYYQVFFS